jgi:hypothetical protein
MTTGWIRNNFTHWFEVCIVLAEVSNEFDVILEPIDKSVPKQSAALHPQAASLLSGRNLDLDLLNHASLQFISLQALPSPHQLLSQQF